MISPSFPYSFSFFDSLSMFNIHTQTLDYQVNVLYLSISRVTVILSSSSSRYASPLVSSRDICVCGCIICEWVSFSVVGLCDQEIEKVCVSVMCLSITDSVPTNSLSQSVCLACLVCHGESDRSVRMEKTSCVDTWLLSLYIQCVCVSSVNYCLMSIALVDCMRVSVITFTPSPFYSQKQVCVCLLLSFLFVFFPVYLLTLILTSIRVLESWHISDKQNWQNFGSIVKEEKPRLRGSTSLNCTFGKRQLFYLYGVSVSVHKGKTTTCQLCVSGIELHLDWSRLDVHPASFYDGPFLFFFLSLHLVFSFLVSRL